MENFWPFYDTLMEQLISVRVYVISRLFCMFFHNFIYMYIYFFVAKTAKI